MSAKTYLPAATLPVALRTCAFLQPTATFDGRKTYDQNCTARYGSDGKTGLASYFNSIQPQN